MALPFEFAIEGTPASQQARRRDRVRVWTRQVRETAELHWDSAPPFDGMISVNILYIFDSTPLDVDNIPKPILDALKGLVYVDDGQVTDLVCRKRLKSEDLRIASSSPVFDAFLDNNSFREFVFIRVSGAPGSEVLL